MPNQTKRTLLTVQSGATAHGMAVTHLAARLFGSTVAKRLLLTSVALVAIQSGNVRALTIGDLQVRSALGQPFVASTTARLAPGEALAPGCIGAVADTPGGNASRVLLSAEVALIAASGEYPVRITSAAPLNEPMYEIQLKISCPGILALAKNYIVMLDLGMASLEHQPVAMPAAETATVPPQTLPVVATATDQENPATTEIPTRAPVQALSLPASASQTGTVEAETVSAETRAMPANTSASIAAGSNYRVLSGDTLLTIAERIEDRAGLSTRQLASLILLTNPSAFIGGNADLIKMGFVITVPSGLTTISSGENRELTGTSPAPSSAAAIISATAATGTQVTQPAVPPEISAALTSEREVPPEVAIGESIPAETNEQETPAQNVAENGAEISAPTTDLPLGATGAGNPAGSQSPDTRQTALAGAAPAAATTPAEPNQLLASGSGILVGAILAALILGRGYIAAWLPGLLTRRKQLPTGQTASTEAAIDPDVFGDERSSTAPDQLADQAATDTSGEPVAGLADSSNNNPGNQGQDLGDEDAEKAIEAALAQAEAVELSRLANAEMPATAELSATDPDTTPKNTAPRISLRAAGSQDSAVDFDMSDMEEPLESTRRYSDPSMLADDNLAATTELAKPSVLDDSSDMHNLFGAPDTDDADLDVTSTMHDIFSAASTDLADNAETEEIPDLRNRLSDNSFASIDIDNTSSLQALSESVVNGDDTLSKTLTQALGLLEQDYEDELTASQILEQKDIQKAFARHAAIDD